MTVEELRDRITTIGSEFIVSSFLSDRWTINSGNTVNGMWQYIPNHNETSGKPAGLLGMGIFRLRALVEGDLTVAERCMAQLAFAKTVSIAKIPTPFQREKGNLFTNSLYLVLPRMHGMELVSIRFPPVYPLTSA